MKYRLTLLALAAMSTLSACATGNAGITPDPQTPEATPELTGAKPTAKSTAAPPGAPDPTQLLVTYPQDTKWTAVVPPDKEGRGVYVSPMVGDLQTKGPTSFLMKFDAGLPSTTHSHTNDYWAVVVAGNYRHYLTSQPQNKVFTPGTTWRQKGGVLHEDTCVGPEACIIQIFYPNGWDVQLPTKAN